VVAPWGNGHEALGVSEESLVAVACEGRRSNVDGRLSMLELAAVLIELGAESAINLDGGVSTTLVHRGHLLNRPYSTRTCTRLAQGRQRPRLRAARLRFRGVGSRRMRSAVVLRVFLPALALAGCGGDEGNGTRAAGEAASFVDVPWVLAAGLDVESWEASAPSIVFAGETVGGSTSCSRFTTPYTVDGETLEIGTIDTSPAWFGVRHPVSRAVCARTNADRRVGRFVRATPIARS
jgi:hypothetical protein